MTSSYCHRYALLVGFYLLILGFGAQTFSPPKSGFFSDIDGISIAPGMGHICVLELKHGSEVGGRARCWGDEEENGKTEPPKEVTFVQLASGSSFTCGITLEQTVICWGSVNFGRTVPGIFTQITASEQYACGVKTDGGLFCWGQSHVLKETPKQRGGELDQPLGHRGQRKYVQVSCSTHHCCALDTNAHAHCWGHGHEFGEMLPPSKKNITSVGIVKSVDILDASDEADEASEDDREEEVDEEEVDDEDDDDIEYDDDGHEANDDVLLERLQFKQLSVGEGFSCGIAFREERENATHPVQEGDLVCWGGKRKHGNMPHHIVGPFKQVSVGNLGVCAIYQAIHQDNNYGEVDGSSEGRMQCWGFVTHLVSAKGTAWDQVSVGTLSVCAVSMISELQCWGTGLHDVTRRPMDIEIA